MKPMTITNPALLMDGDDKQFRRMLHDTLAFAARIEEIRARFGEVTIEINRLVRLGMVDKQINQFDRRRVLLCVTTQARQALDDLKRIQAPANDALFACLDKDKFIAFAEIMRDLVGCVDNSLALLAVLSRVSAA
jgi:hypothetical protein